jgi:hypothetical protein
MSEYSSRVATTLWVLGLERTIWDVAHTVPVYMSRLTGAVGANWPARLESWTADDDGPPWVTADESGTTGEDLLGDQPVIAHATVRIDDETASEILSDLRTRAKSTQAEEVKFKHFRRGRAAQALADTLAPGGALVGRVNIVVAHKPYVAVGKVIDLLVEEYAHERGINLYEGRRARKMARTLFKDGPRGLGEVWAPLLSAFVRMARPGPTGRTAEVVDAFFAQVEAAQSRCHQRSLEPILSMLSRSAAHAKRLVAAIDDAEEPLLSSLDAHVALLPDSLRYWYREIGKPYCLLHDDNVVLTPRLVQRTMLGLARPFPSMPWGGKAVLALFSTGSSRAHPSIQLADRAAGSGRLVTSDYLNNAPTAPQPLTDAVTPLITCGLLPDDSFWERRRYFS